MYDLELEKLLLQYPDIERIGSLLDTKKMALNLQESVDRTLVIFTQLTPEQEAIQKSENVNLPVWELGHMAWFQEFWVHRYGSTTFSSILDEADFLYNSSKVEHDARWHLMLPNKLMAMNYLQQVTQRTLDRLTSGAIGPCEAYLINLALLHNDMHNEAFAYTWQFLGFEAPFGGFEENPVTQTSAQDLLVTHSVRTHLGSKLQRGFIFDNEKWLHEQELKPYAISSHCVTNQEYLHFLEKNPHIPLPRYWRISAGVVQEKVFGRWQDINLSAPVRHITLEQAQQYCQAIGRLLPTEAQWVHAKRSFPSEWQDANLWEWTSSVFLPFEGFTPDPYEDYSLPWMGGDHQVLKGFSSWTSERLRRLGYRNFYKPHRSDIFCGFRTCEML